MARIKDLLEERIHTLEQEREEWRQIALGRLVRIEHLIKLASDLLDYCPSVNDYSWNVGFLSNTTADYAAVLERANLLGIYASSRR